MELVLDPANIGIQFPKASPQWPVRVRILAAVHEYTPSQTSITVRAIPSVIAPPTADQGRTVGTIRVFLSGLSARSISDPQTCREGYLVELQGYYDGRDIRCHAIKALDYEGFNDAATVETLRKIQRGLPPLNHHGY